MNTLSIYFIPGFWSSWWRQISQIFQFWTWYLVYIIPLKDFGGEVTVIKWREININNFCAELTLCQFMLQSYTSTTKNIKGFWNFFLLSKCLSKMHRNWSLERKGRRRTEQKIYIIQFDLLNMLFMNYLFGVFCSFLFSLLWRFFC